MPKSLIHLKADHETRKLLESMGISEDDLYDQSPTGDDLYSIPIVEGLTPAEYKQALKLRRYYHGVMLVTGKPGAGKGLFVIWLLHKMKRYFGRRIILDYRPRKLFGPYIPFNEGLFLEDLARMTEVATAKTKPLTQDEKLTRISKMSKGQKGTLASHWLAQDGGVLLQGAAIALDEAKNYLHNRAAMLPMGIMLGKVATIHRHLDLLMIAMSPLEREIDAISFLPLVTHRVRCSWSTDGRAICKIYQTVYTTARGGVLQARGRPYTIRLDGDKPREELGGKRFYDLYNSKDPKALRVTGSLVRKPEIDEHGMSD